MKKFFKKRQNKFIGLIQEQATLTLEGLDALNSSWKRIAEESAALLRKKEKQADEVRRILIDELNRTFITPLTGRIFFPYPGQSTMCSTMLTGR